MTTLTPAPFRKRLLAVAYDFLIMLFLSTIVIIIIELLLVGAEKISENSMLNTVLKPLWFVPPFLYLAHYWRKSGQTPSMRIWKVRVVSQTGERVTWLQALLRYVCSFLGLGLIYCPFNKERNGLQDVLSNTRLIVVEPQSNTKRDE